MLLSLASSLFFDRKGNFLCPVEIGNCLRSFGVYLQAFMVFCEHHCTLPIENRSNIKLAAG